MNKLNKYICICIFVRLNLHICIRVYSIYHEATGSLWVRTIFTLPNADVYGNPGSIMVAFDQAGAPRTSSYLGALWGLREVLGSL